MLLVSEGHLFGTAFSRWSLWDAALLFRASEHAQHDQRCNPPFPAAAMVVLAYCGYRVAN